MNAYFVMSEELEHHSYYEPPEYYRIVEIVVARNRSQAKYLVWKQDCIDDLIHSPKFSIRLVEKNISGRPRIMDYKEARPFWEKVPDKI